MSLSRATGILDKMVAWTESTPVNLCSPIFSRSHEFFQSCLYNFIVIEYMFNEFGLIMFSSNFLHKLAVYAWLGCTYNIQYLCKQL